MSVKEYALDVNLSVEEVMKKIKSLGYEINNEDDMLTEEQIIEMDNVSLEDEEEKTYLEESANDKDYDLEEELDDKAEEMASASNIKYKDTSNKVKKKNKSSL